MFELDRLALDGAMKITKQWQFDLAKEKLKSNKNWSDEKVNRAVSNYRKYMALTKALNGYQLVPNEEIDEIWHMHILDTRGYMKDCEDLFGEYLHHYPYFGMLSEENEKQWFKTQELSNKLWSNLFGVELYSHENMGQKCPQVCPCHIDDINNTIESLKKVV